MTNQNTNTANGHNKQLRCAVVGVGRMGRHHARTYANLKDVTLVGVVDADTERAATIAEQHNCKVFPNVQALLDHGVDAVSIAVPTSMHHQTAEPLLKAGVACLIEKPLALDAQQAEALRDTAEKAGACLMVGHIERFNPVIRALKRAQDRGLPIIPRFIEIHRVSPMSFRSVDIGVVLDMMIHDLDVVLMLMDGIEPTDIQASGVPVVTEHEDFCNARLTFNRPGPPETGGGKCVVNITASRLALKTERVMRITGENAYVKIDYANKSGTVIRKTANELQMHEVREQLRSGADLTDLKWNELVTIDNLEIDDAEPILAEIQSFLSAVRQGIRPEIDASAGLVNVKTALRIAETAKADWNNTPPTQPPTTNQNIKAPTQNSNHKSPVPTP